MNDLEVYAGAALLGTLAGMRSMAAPAVLGQLSRNGGLSDVAGPLAIIAAPRAPVVTGVLAVGELIVDKLPFAPNRTAAGPLVGRALMGGFSGAVVCSSRKKSIWIGAFIGAAAAVGAAYGAYELRKQAGKKLKTPDVVFAIAEDVVVGALGKALTSRFTPATE